MIKLIKNEYCKIFFKRTTYVLIILALLMGLGFNILSSLSSSTREYDEYGKLITEETKKQTPKERLDSEYNAIKTDYDIALKEKETNDPNYNEDYYNRIKKNYDIVKYKVDNNITASYDEYEANDIQTTNSFLSSFYKTPSLLMVISILMIVIAGGCVAKEFSDGTIKFLLINPVKRSKIFWSKLLACISLTVIATAVYFLFCLIICMLFHGVTGVGGSYVYYSGETVKSYSAILYIGQKCLLGMIDTITMVILSITISSLLRSSSIAIGLSIGVLLAGSSISLVLSSLQQDWGRYLLFSNLDLSDIFAGHSIFIGQTATFSIINIIIHVIILILTAHDGFTRREV